MIGKGIINKKVATIDEVLDILESRKEAGELTYEQQIALEHTKKLATEKQRIAKVKKELEAMQIKEECIAKILEIMPSNIMLLKQVLAGCKNSLDDETVAKVLELIKGKASA
jgi:DNA-directed RNA polymerase subunit F